MFDQKRIFWITLFLLLPCAVYGTEKNEWSLGLDVGLSPLIGDLRPIFNDEILFGTHSRYGVSDHFALELNLFYSLHNGESIFSQSILDHFESVIQPQYAIEIGRNTLAYVSVGGGIAWFRSTMYEMEISRNFVNGQEQIVAERRSDLDINDVLPLLRTGAGIDFFAWDPMSLGINASYSLIFNSKSETLTATLNELALATGESQNPGGYSTINCSLRFTYNF